MRRRRGAFAEEQIKYSISQCSIWLDLQFCVRWPTYSNLISEILLGFGKPGVSISLLFCHEYILPLSPLSKSKPLFEKLTQFRQVATKCPFAWGGPGGWLRLMRFDNRLIIDSFQKAVCILKWLLFDKETNSKGEMWIPFLENTLLEMLWSVYCGKSRHNTWSPPFIRILKNFHKEASYDTKQREYKIFCQILSFMW